MSSPKLIDNTLVASNVDCAENNLPPLPSYGTSEIKNAKMQWLLTKPEFGVIQFHLCDKCRNILFQNKNKILLQENKVEIKFTICIDCANNEINSKLYFYDFKKKRSFSHSRRYAFNPYLPRHAHATQEFGSTQTWNKTGEMPKLFKIKPKDDLKADQEQTQDVQM